MKRLLSFLLLIIYASSYLCIAVFISNRQDTDIKEEDKIKALENKALIEGDIVPNLDENSNDANKSHLYLAITSKSLKWPNAMINFRLDKRFYDDEVDTIIDAMYRIERVSCIRFRPYKPIYGLDFVKIIKGNGCFSSAGRAGGEQSLSLGRGCLNVGTIQHELLHTIGFFHHHMRSDRDKYLKIHYKNIKDEYKAQFNKLSRKEARLLTPFDYNSIMIYGSKAFSKNNKPTMTAKVKNVKLTYPFNKTRLTKFDIIAINKLYKCTPRDRKRSSLIFFSNAESDDSEVDYPKVDDISIDEAKEDTSNDERENRNSELENDQLLKNKLEKEKLKKEKLEKERLEKKRLAEEKMRKEKLQREKLEKQRKEKIEKEKSEKIRLEKSKLEKAKLERNKLKMNNIGDKVNLNRKDALKDQPPKNESTGKNDELKNENDESNESKLKNKLRANEPQVTHKSTEKPDLGKEQNMSKVELSLDDAGDLHLNDSNIKDDHRTDEGEDEQTNDGQKQIQIPVDSTV